LLTGKTLQHNQEEVDKPEKYGTHHEQTDAPNMPSLDCNAEIKVTNSEFEEAIGENIE
jgi:hypothetical protein